MSIRVKKSLGQNFLTSMSAIQKIVDSSDYYPGLTILEVGPGRGVLTEALLKKFDKVVAVEKDHELIGFLTDKFAREIGSGQLRVIEGDILELKPEKLGLTEEKSDLVANFPHDREQAKPISPRSSYAIIANIPYYITGQFLRNWLSTGQTPTLQSGLRYMVLMIQKEVAERIVARDGKESLLSISVKIYGEPKYIETVKRGSFYPIPNVDSAILKITTHLEDACPGSRRRKFPSKEQEDAFFALLRAGFAHKRKLLTSNLKEALFLERPARPSGAGGFNLAQIKGIFETCKIDPKARAEDLPLEDWIGLASLIG